MASPRNAPWFLAALCVLLTACGGGGGGGGGASSSSATFALTIGDAPVDDLSTLEVTVVGAFVTYDDGSESANLLSTARRVNLLDLALRSLLLDLAPSRAQPLLGARIVFDPLSVQARDLTGNPVAIRMVGSQASGTFAPPLVIAPGSLVKLHFEIDVETSVGDDAQNPGGYEFTPVLRLSRRTGTEDPLDEIHGQVQAVDASSGTMVVQLRDDDTGAPYGTLRVLVDGQTALFDDGGASFPSTAAFLAAAAGRRIEALGGLRDSGVFAATMVKIDDGRSIAKIQGTLSDLDLGGQLLRLRIEQVERGASVVTPVLANLGNPAEIDVSLSGATVLVEGVSPRAGNLNDLRVGQEVKVKFATFPAAPPFPAHRVEIEDEQPEFTGTLFDTSGLPGSFQMRLSPSDAAIAAGLVASPSTPVLVTLDGAERIWLDAGNQPTLGAFDLQNGLRVRLRGILSGTPTAPMVDPSEVRVRPGRLEGDVVSGNAANGSFVVDVKSTSDPFGGNALPDPVTLTFGAGAVVQGDATSVTGFFQLLLGLGGGASLEVRVEGLADGGGGAEVYAVEVRLR